MKENMMILGENRIYSMDSYETGLNNNVLVVGTSGAGKTRGIVEPNIIQATGSYVISDPKGNLYNKYRDYLRSKGYRVMKLDFTDPGHSAHYNFMNYIHDAQDIAKVAYMLIGDNRNTHHLDPFWDESSRLLLQSIIAYLKYYTNKKSQNLHSILSLVEAGNLEEESYGSRSTLDYVMKEIEEKDSGSFAVRKYRQFRCGANKTLKGILITTNAKLALFDNPEINKLTEDDTIDLRSIGDRKTALFVVVSDTDRSLDGLVNIFFTQAMNELCSHADKECRGNHLPIPTRFILDDFATNVKIAEFPRMISSIRSRWLSTMIMIQSEAQLESGYGRDGDTIISNCDTYVYMGGNDVKTAMSVAERCDVPVKKILNMPVRTNWIFRRGQQPIYGNNLDLEAFKKERNLRPEMERR